MYTCIKKPMNHCKKIKLLRIASGYSREQMAEKLNITPRQYANIENGKCKLDIQRLLEISKIFNVDSTTILGNQNTLVIELDKMNNNSKRS